MAAIVTRTARLEARISTDLHILLKRAAEMEGRSVTDFVVTAVQEAAEKRVEREQIIRLSLADQLAFADAILHPKDPGAAMRRAFQHDRELIQVAK